MENLIKIPQNLEYMWDAKRTWQVNKTFNKQIEEPVSQK